METTWDPQQILQCLSEHAIVVLNGPINNWSEKHLLKFWQTAKVKITIDGGTDMWFNYINKKTGHIFPKVPQTFLPDLVTGDFDSISKDTLEKLKQTNVEVIETEDQDETDYTKALHQLKEHCEQKNITINHVYVITETSGRFDHVMGTINTLFKCQEFFGQVKIIHVSNQELTWLLPSGKHKILIPETLFQSHCGLIPFGSSENCISSTGLKWNLDKTCLKFGGLISTSNTYDKSPEVVISTDTPIIWTMGIEPLLL